MLKHQQHFNATMEQLGDGTALFNELNASLESVNQGLGWLERLEAGDESAATEVMDKHGPEIETVSTEGVQVHINSNQVQMAIDFLKKWIPRILRFLREVIGRIVKWVKEKLHNLGPRLANLKQKNYGNKQLVIPVRGEGGVYKAAAVMVHAHSFDRVMNPVDMDNVKKVMANLNEWAYANAMATSGGWAELNLRACHDTGDRLHRFVTEWLNFGEQGLSFAKVNSNEAGTALLEYANGLPDARGTFNAAVEKIGERFDTTIYILVTEADVKKMVAQLDQLQLKLTAASSDLNHLVDDAMRTLRAYEGNNKTFKVDQNGPDDLAKMVRAATRLIQYMYNATSVGLQGRLSLLGTAVGMLEKAREDKG